MAAALIQYETIDREQIAAIMAGREPGPPSDWRAHDDVAGSSGTSAGDSTVGSGAKPSDGVVRPAPQA